MLVGLRHFSSSCFPLDGPLIGYASIEDYRCTSAHSWSCPSENGPFETNMCYLLLKATTLSQVKRNGRFRGGGGGRLLG
jgi:hypothetical protein